MVGIGEVGSAGAYPGRARVQQLINTELKIYHGRVRIVLVRPGGVRRGEAEARAINNKKGA